MPEPKKFNPLQTPPMVLLANYYPFQPCEIARERWSPSNLFLPATHGKGIMTVGHEQTFELKQGQILHVPWATTVRYEADRNEPFVVIGLHFAYMPWRNQTTQKPFLSHHAPIKKNRGQPPPVAQPFSHPFILEPPPTSSVFDLATELAHTYESTTQQYAPLDREAKLRSLALLFLLAFQSACKDRNKQPMPTPHPQAGLVREIISWMEHRYSRQLSRAELADRAGVSESTLSTAFQAVTGQAPIDYLINLRLSHAKRLLASSRKRINEIAHHVGIPDAYYFSKLFKRRHGLSPMQYRKQRRL